MYSMDVTDRMDNSYFDNDIFSRYMSSRRPYVSPSRSVGKGGQTEVITDSAKEKRLRAQIESSPEETIASWVWHFDDVKSRIQSLLNRGRLAEATKLNEETSSIISEYSDDLFRMTKLGNTGPIGSRLSATAYDILNAGWLNSDDNSVVINGAKMTIGAALSDGGQFIVDQFKSEFEGYGFSKSAGELYFNGTEDQRNVMKELIDPFRNKENIKPANHIQLNEAADDLTSQWDTYYSVFGDGIASFVKGVKNTHKDSGGIIDTMHTLRDIAANLKETKNLEGRDLVRSVMNGYNSISDLVFSTDTRTIDNPYAKSMPASITPDDRMRLDSIISSGAKEATRRGVSVDLSDPAFRNAVKDINALLAYSGSLGINLIADAKDSGRNMRDAFGDYVANAMTGVPQPSSNIVNGLQTVKSTLDKFLTGGHDYQEMVYKLSGKSADYMASIDKSNNGFSSCPEADNIALTAKKYIYGKLVPEMMNGKTMDDAFQSIMNSGRFAAVDFTLGLASELSRSFVGDGKETASNMLADSIVENFMSGKPVNIQDTIGRLGFMGEYNEENLPSEITTLRNWYNGNTDVAMRFPELVQQTRKHLAAMGIQESRIEDCMSRLASDAAASERAGGNPVMPYLSANRIDRYLSPEYGVDEEGQVILANVSDNIGPLNRIGGFKFNGNEYPVGFAVTDPEAFAGLQSILQEAKNNIDSVNKSTAIHLKNKQTDENFS